MSGAKRLRLVALLAVVGIALATLVPPASQRVADQAGASDEPDPEERCEGTVTDFADALQGHVDAVAGMSAGELAEASQNEGIQGEAQRYSQRVEALGCDEEQMRAWLTDELDGLEAEGLVAKLTAESVRAAALGAHPSLPTELEVLPSDDLAAVVTMAPPGATLRLAAAEHQVSEPLVIRHGMTLVGAGRDETTIASTAGEAALVYVGTGELGLEALTLAHEGEEPASVAVVQRGSYRIADARVTGGTADPDGVGGAGLVLGPEEHDPSADLGRGWGARAVEDVTVDGNEGAGIMVRGAEAPDVTGATLVDNGTCGICFLESSGGTLRQSRAASNEMGIAVAGSADPRVQGNDFERNRYAGIVVEGDGEGVFRGNEIVANGELGVAVSDRGSPTLVDNEISDHGDAGVVLGGSSAPSLLSNRLSGNPVGIWVDDEASPRIEGNALSGGGDAGMIYAASAAGEGRENRLEGFEIGIEVRDAGAPELRGNVLDDSGEAGLVYRDEAEGSAHGTACTGEAPGIALLDEASPTLDGNDCEVVDQR